MTPDETTGPQGNSELAEGGKVRGGESSWQGAFHLISNPTDPATQQQTCKIGHSQRAKQGVRALRIPRWG